MSKVVIVTALALALGCKTAAMMGPRDKKEPLGNVARDKDGVCAHHEISNSNDVIKACARQDAAGAALLYSDLSYYEDAPFGDGASWHVVVTRADGAVVLDTHLTNAQPKRRYCVAGVCIDRFVSVDRVAAPWQAGRYELRYTCAADGLTRKMSITLQ